ncbi:MAG: Mu transposase C-terminal domain-containing protein [Oscillospiraceae bacterium]
MGTASNGRPCYLIPLSALDVSLQRKWYKSQAIPFPSELKESPKSQPAREAKPLEAYTIQQREQIDYWIGLLERWQDFRSNYPGPCSEADQAFHQKERLEFSIQTLYRRWTSYKSGDLDGLIERRGQWRKGRSDIQPDVWKVFLTYYLDQAKDPVTKCIRSTEQYLKLRVAEGAVPESLLRDFPSKDAFYRNIERDIPAAVVALNRDGKKALHDRLAPYIRRTYDGMLSNDYWIADNHTFDFMSLGDNGRPHRLYLTAMLDARSSAIVGWQVTASPCGDATLSALRKGIKPPGDRPMNGIPINLYVDNGSEFLVHDIGGRGHRKRKNQQQDFEPPGVFKRLGMEMVNAIPGNPEAKIIERIFKILKDELSRSITTFCGGTIAERPERLNRILKAGRDVPTDAEIIEAVDWFVEGYFNHLPYNGPVTADRGKPRIQVYNENLKQIRLPASEDDLNLMMMRSSRPVKVGRRGVKLTIAGYTIDYWADDFLMEWQDKKVYYRYDPDDLSYVRVYNEEDQFISILPADDVAIMEYGASKDDIRGGMRKINKYNQVVKEWTDDRVLGKDEKISVFRLMQLQARQTMENPPDYMSREPKVFEFVRAEEDTYSYPMAVGEVVDNGAMLASMIESAKQRQKEDE